MLSVRRQRIFAAREGTLDVHAPHEPIHGVKDFLLHLLTITVGLLIAVGIEGCVELHREHKLVKEARATMREEIHSNSESMNSNSALLAWRITATAVRNSMVRPEQFCSCSMQRSAVPGLPSIDSAPVWPV